MPKKKSRKTNKKKISNKKIRLYIKITIIYAFAMMIISGVVKYYFPELVIIDLYFFDLPLDIWEGLVIVGFSIYSITMILAGLGYQPSNILR